VFPSIEGFFSPLPPLSLVVSPSVLISLLVSIKYDHAADEPLKEKERERVTEKEIAV
jgi:hypothetical protein